MEKDSYMLYKYTNKESPKDSMLYIAETDGTVMYMKKEDDKIWEHLSRGEQLLAKIHFDKNIKLIKKLNKKDLFIELI